MNKIKIRFRLIICITAVLIITGILLIITRTLITKKSSNKTIYIVKNEVYSNTINIAGVVSAAQEQTLQALADGTVVAVYVKQGDRVKKGDIIIQLDDTEQVYNLAKHDYDMATTKITGSKREIELMETERLALVQKIAERKVIATFDGIIADIDVSVGDSLEAKDSVGTLVDVSYLIADVEITETDVSKLQSGQEVNFTFPAYNGNVKGYVVGYPAIGEVTSRGVTVVNARLRIDDYPPIILPNFSFSGEIKISPDENYILVSRYAVANENKQAYVILAKTNQKVAVKVTPYNNEYVKVEEGLQGGEVVLGQSDPSSSGMQRIHINEKSNNNPPPGGDFPGGFPGGGGR